MKPASSVNFQTADPWSGYFLKIQYNPDTNQLQRDANISHMGQLFADMPISQNRPS